MARLSKKLGMDRSAKPLEERTGEPLSKEDKRHLGKKIQDVRHALLYRALKNSQSDSRYWGVADVAEENLNLDEKGRRYLTKDRLACREALLARILNEDEKEG